MCYFVLPAGDNIPHSVLPTDKRKKSTRKTGSMDLTAAEQPRYTSVSHVELPERENDFPSYVILYIVRTMKCFTSLTRLSSCVQLGRLWITHSEARLQVIIKLCFFIGTVRS